MKTKTITEIEEYLETYKYNEDLDDYKFQKDLIPECVILKKHNVGSIFYDFHHHDLYEILYIVSGKVTYLVENKKYTLEAGEMVLISPSVLHKLQTIIEEPCERIVITFTERYAKLNSTSNTDLLKIFKNINQTKYHKLSFNNAFKRRFEAILETMQRIMFEERYGTDVIYNSSFCSLLVLINRESESTISDIHPISYENKLILKAGNYIEENLDKNVTIVVPRNFIRRQFERNIKKYLENGKERLERKYVDLLLKLLEYINEV